MLIGGCPEQARTRLEAYARVVVLQQFAADDEGKTVGHEADLILEERVKLSVRFAGSKVRPETTG